MDDNKEIPNEGYPADPEQPAVVDAAVEIPEEPVEPEAESVEQEQAVPDMMETRAEDVPAEETIAASPDEAQTTTSETEEASAAADEPVLKDEAATPEGPSQTDDAEPTTEPESVEEVGETVVETADAAESNASEQEPIGGEQPTESPEDSVPPASDLQPSESEPSPTVQSVIEAILFATDEPLPESRLAGIVETTGKQVRESVEHLNARYETHGNAFRIEQIAGGYQMLTQPIYNSWLKKMLRVRSDNKLSPAAMETLAIIAYKQPIIRADIEAIRGVAVGEVIRSLMYKGLVKIAGRAEILGRPMLYGTTKKFLEIFGLNSIKDLPKAEDLKNPDRG